MKYEDLILKFNELECEALEALRSEIALSTLESEHCHTNIIKVDVLGYTELAVIDDKLTFLNKDGYHYGIYTEATLEDLIDILNKIN